MDEQCYYRVSIKGIAVDATGRFLLAREEDDFWDTLGGGLDHGEDPIVGLRREIQEETGLEVTYVSSSPIYFITAPRRHHTSFVANVIYEVKLASLEFVPSDECQELRFFTIDEARTMSLFPGAEKLLEVFDPAKHI